MDDLREVPRAWARLRQPGTLWHRIAWHRKRGAAAELVALCGQGIRMVDAEQDASRGAPGLGCGDCATVMYQAATGLTP